MRETEIILILHLINNQIHCRDPRKHTSVYCDKHAVNKQFYKVTFFRTVLKNIYLLYIQSTFSIFFNDGTYYLLMSTHA